MNEWDFSSGFNLVNFHVSGVRTKAPHQVRRGHYKQNHGCYDRGVHPFFS